MSIVDRSLRTPACLADHPVHQTAVKSVLYIWELHVGTVQLFIVGPGPDAWLKCSEASYDGTIGSCRERAIARRAVRILNPTRREDKDAGPTEIRAALDAAEADYERESQLAAC